MVQAVNPYALEAIYKDHGPRGLAKFIGDGLVEKKFAPESFSLKQLGFVVGAIDKYNEESSIRNALAVRYDTESVSPDRILDHSHRAWESQRAGQNTFATESDIGSSLFQIICGALIGKKVIDAYESTELNDDKLVTNMPSRMRSQRLAGMTALGGPDTVQEGMPYGETGFTEKYVTTNESKKGRILSITEELIGFDQTGEIYRRATAIAEMTRQERARSIFRGVQDADYAAGVYVYRPSGTGTQLYKVNASQKNYVGVSGVTNYSAAVALTDWTSLEKIRHYRATQVTDDRIDGTARAIGMINMNLQLLVPESLAGTALSIVNATEVSTEGATTSAHTATKFGNPVKGLVKEVISSPFVDEVNRDNWYLGDFKKQFIWTEIWPIQTFLQGSNSEAAFERDVAMRVKVRYFGGLSAVDTAYVTMVDGA